MPHKLYWFLNQKKSKLIGKKECDATKKYLSEEIKDQNRRKFYLDPYDRAVMKIMKTTNTHAKFCQSIAKHSSIKMFMDRVIAKGQQRFISPSK